MPRTGTYVMPEIGRNFFALLQDIQLDGAAMCLIAFENTVLCYNF